MRKVINIATGYTVMLIYPKTELLQKLAYLV